MLHASYSPLHALAGGILIGLASLLAMLASGKYPGISGMIDNVLKPQPGDRTWRILFLGGLLLGAAAAFQWVDAASAYQPVRSLAALAVAGLLVGFGTRMGGGCTSGHGVCGISTGAQRSIIATLIFMVAGIVTVTLLRMLGGSWSP